MMALATPVLRLTLLGSILASAACARPATTPDTLPAPSHADATLQRKIEDLARGFNGDVGVYVRNLRTGATATINADSVFPTASMIKLPLLLTLNDQVERGLLNLNAVVKYPDTLKYASGESTDVVGYMVPGDSLPLSEVAFLMLTVSDNFASLWIQQLVGGGMAVNEWLGAHGFANTRVNSRTPGREDARTKYGWGQTTPREISDALVMIREGRAISARASERMYRALTNSYWKDEALSQVPPYVQVASKQGAVDRSRSEVLLVNAPAGDYVLAVITKNQTDTSYEANNEGYRLIRTISRAVYEHFNPDDRWRP